MTTNHGILECFQGPTKQTLENQYYARTLDYLPTADKAMAGPEKEYIVHL
jgi:hypothetical protein